MNASLTRLYPTPGVERPLVGTYLAHDLRHCARAERPYVYANFVSSLDGRTSQIDRELGRLRPPRAVANDHDWRLYLELATQADAVITSSSRLSAMLDEDRDEIQCVEEIDGALGAWRRERGLPARPMCIILSKTLDLPVDRLLAKPHCDLFVLAGSDADKNAARKLEAGGVEVRVSASRWVVGRDIERLACERGWRTLYAIGGPDVLYTMLDARMLDRLYLTVAHLALAGRDYDTLARGDTLTPPFGFRLHELYLDPARSDKPEILFTSYDKA